MGEIVLEDMICENCGSFIDECICACPYCGETALCECCVGIHAVTGG